MGQGGVPRDEGEEQTQAGWCQHEVHARALVKNRKMHRSAKFVLVGLQLKIYVIIISSLIALILTKICVYIPVNFSCVLSSENVRSTKVLWTANKK